MKTLITGSIAYDTIMVFPDRFKNHLLPDGNKRCAFLATVEFVERNGRTWVPAPSDPDETDHVIRGIASGEVSEAAFRVRMPRCSRRTMLCIGDLHYTSTCYTVCS